MPRNCTRRYLVGYRTQTGAIVDYVLNESNSDGASSRVLTIFHPNSNLICLPDLFLRRLILYLWWVGDRAQFWCPPRGLIRCPSTTLPHTGHYRARLTFVRSWSAMRIKIVKSPVYLMHNHYLILASIYYLPWEMQLEA